MANQLVDFSILDFNTYGEYLASFTTKEDYKYIRTGSSITDLIMLGYRSANAPYTLQEFLERRVIALDALRPKVFEEKPFSRFMSRDNTDPVLMAFKKREPKIFAKALSTIVFVMFTNKKGSEISAYLDLGMSWRFTKAGAYNRMDWQGIYEGTALLRPKIHHLSYRNSQKNITLYTDSESFHVVHHDEYGLMFRHKGDHKLIPVGSRNTPFDRNVIRSMIDSPNYGTIAFYDHTLRKKA